MSGNLDLTPNNHRLRWMGEKPLQLAMVIVLFILLTGCRAHAQITPQLSITNTSPIPSTPISTIMLASTSEPISTPTGTPTQTLTPTLAASITATPGLGIGSKQVSTIDGSVMVYVPAGEFMMGAFTNDLNANRDEKPRHKVFLDAFWMYQTEVTNNQYNKCVTAQACQAPQYNKSFTRAHYFDDPQFSNYPVIWVSWNDASDYCQWAGGRLPTEAEWEKAARGGLDGKLYPWGDDAPVCDQLNLNGANFESCSPGDTTSAGSFPPNNYGLYDMAGNVWEWVSDWYGPNYYSTYKIDAWPANPLGTQSGYYRVLRGGSWHDRGQDLRISLRPWNDPLILTYYYYVIGFRCAVSP